MCKGYRRKYRDEIIIQRIRIHCYNIFHVLSLVDTSDILEERRRVSVKTKRFKEARRLLHNGKQFLILVGYQQDGLSSLGYDLLLEFPERENFVVDNPDQVLTCLSGEKSSIIFADDIFGTTYFDVGRFEDWQRNMGRIKRLLKKHNGILLLGLHLELTEEVKCKPFYDNYQDDILNISIPDLQLDRNEMKNILTRNISVQKEHLKIEICKSLSEEKNKMENENPCPINCIISEETIDNISKTANPSGFPGEVALFTKNVDNINRGEMFFSLPSDRLFSEIEELRNADKSNSEQGMHKYLALIAVFIYGKLNLEKMEAHSKYLKKSEKQLNAYLALCFGKQRRLVSHDFPNMSAVMIGVAKRFKCLATVAESVKKGVQKLLGRYLVESKRGRIEFASISVERTVAICCAKEYPEEVIMFSSSHVFEHVIGPNDIFADKQLHVPITNTGKPVRALIKRLLTLDGEQILQHPAMQSGWFAGLFVQYLQKDKHKFTTFVESSGNNTGTCVLTLSLKSPYRPSSATRSSCLAEDVIMSNQWQTIRNRNPSFADERENELLKKCCEMGWENAYLRMRDKLQKSLTRLCLILAINSCSTKIIIDMIQNRGRTLTICDWYYALEHACKKLDEDDKKTLNIILLITRKKVNFEYQNGSIGSIIHRAADSGNDLLLGKVLALCGNKDLQNAIGKTCLHLATAGNHLSCVRIAIENGVSQHIVDACGELPIHYACRHGFLEIADILIAHDGNVVNRASELGQTPLHLAAKHGNVSVIRLLLKQGASANASTKNQELPAHFALAKGYDEALRLLTNAMVFNFPDLTINKLFDKSVKLRNRVAIEMILDKIVYEQDRLTLLNFCLGETLKRRATDPANTDIVAYLLEKGADLFLSGLIEFRCSGTIKRLLIDKGFELNVLDAYRGVFRIKLRPKST